MRPLGHHQQGLAILNNLENFKLLIFSNARINLLLSVSHATQSVVQVANVKRLLFFITHNRTNHIHDSGSDVLSFKFVVATH